jgi:hypothetical protein
VDEVPILGRGDDRQIFNEFFAHYDAPAYVRRARKVQEAFDQLVDRCRRKRDEWLQMVRIRLGLLRALAGDWAALRSWLGEGPIALLRRLEADLKPRLRVPVEPNTSERALRRALAELTESIERFNRRWLAFLSTVDLAPVNEVRDGYNRFYLLEKECAVRSPRLARQGFQRLEPLTTADLTAFLPPLPQIETMGRG